MLFNSIEFALFLPITFGVYWFLLSRNLKAQNLWIVFVSYVFYGWWDWRFLGLVFFSSIVDYLVGLGLLRENRPRRRVLFLLASIVINLGFLGFFKYYNFFVESFAEAFTFFGKSVNPDRLHIVLPVGISFYTFQTMSYSIDVYRRKLEPTKDLIAFLAYVTFFPQLVAGPIERATNLLPQFYVHRVFKTKEAIDGCRQILWGLFKKIVIADNCAVFADQVFQNYTTFSGSTLLLGSFFFAFQIYGDFSGYSDIAIGTSRLFGFTLMRNFAFPYFSRDIAEFWRRWHISLTTWFRDYVYFPMGGSQRGFWVVVRNTIVVFLLSGFWHGANWTFIVWGLLNAIYFLPLLLTGRNRQFLDTVGKGGLPSIKEFVHILATFLLTLIAWVFFRSPTLGDAFSYLGLLFSSSLFTVPQLHPTYLLLLIGAFVALEWIQRDKQHALEFEPDQLAWPVRWAIYYGVLLIMVVYGGEQQDFIYFQF